jgi:hypothetical protein
VELVNLIKAKTQHKSAGQRLEPAQILVDMHGRRLQRFMMQERGYILAVPLVSPKVLHCGKQHFFWPITTSFYCNLLDVMRPLLSRDGKPEYASED